jgi:hypothetical protein
VIESAPLMFGGYPKYSATTAAALFEMPRIKAPDDWQAMTTRPRRPPISNGGGQLHSVHRAGHVDIGEDDPDV